LEPVEGTAAGPTPDVRPDLGRRDAGRHEAFHDLGDGMSPAEALLDLGARVTERPEPAQRDSGGAPRHSPDDPASGDTTSSGDWFTPSSHHAPSTPDADDAAARSVSGPASLFTPAAPPQTEPAENVVDMPAVDPPDGEEVAADSGPDDSVAAVSTTQTSRASTRRDTVESDIVDDTAADIARDIELNGPAALDDADDGGDADGTVTTEAMEAEPIEVDDPERTGESDESGEPDESSEPAAEAVEAPESAPPAPPDPEQILAKYEWTYDPETLHEIVDDEDRLNEIRDMLTAKVNDNTDNASRARLLSLRAVVSRIFGDLHKALADAKLALAHAEATGELRRVAICQARLANVLQWRGEYAEADRLFAEANSSELPDRLRGTMHSHAGRSAYDQGRYMEACMHFERALDLGKEEDPQLLAATELALDAVLRRVVASGWGPYPRTREEILQIVKPPTAAMDEQTDLWGFTDADGETVVPARYADVQPFRDGVAWVRRPESETWELIGEAGDSVIEAADGYLGVSSFAGGLAWVSRDGNGHWIAVDRTNNVTISTGFDDVRPFRRGIAAVRRNGYWGAVDGVGRVIVPFAYDMFATALSDGRYIDGFSDEGLAVVQVGGRKGVVDRSGRTLVDPMFVSLVIHPVAFLMTDDGGRWGALDRKGRILIDPTHPSRVSVTMEIDRLLADARPVL
jgi:tetratricopeptide (TPR) repeat protein